MFREGGKDIRVWCESGASDLQIAEWAVGKEVLERGEEDSFSFVEMFTASFCFS